MQTTEQEKPFDVTLVDSERIKVEVGDHRNPYSINCRQFRKAEERRLIRDDVTRQELEDERIASGRTSYAAAIIHEVVKRGL